MQCTQTGVREVRCLGTYAGVTVFFDPSSQFVEWFREYAGGRLVIDVGCGSGLFIARLHDRQVKAIGVDPRWADERHPHLSNAILPFYAEECELLHRSEHALITFCRPCHDGFVGRTLPLLQPSSEVLYISKPENVELDLEGRAYEAIDAPELPVERVYRVIR